MHERHEVHHFDAQDLDILRMAVGLVPDLEIAAWAVKCSRTKGLQFPLSLRETLHPLFDSASGHFEFKDHKITRADLSAHFPDAFLPIADEHDLIRKTVMVLARVHLIERKTSGVIPEGEDGKPIYVGKPT